MSKMLPWLICLLTLPCLSIPATAAPAVTAQQQLVSEVQTTYQRLHSLQCSFVQLTSTEGRVREGRGQATFYRTKEGGNRGLGIMRWNYEQPTPQVILNNGKELSILTPQDRQLLITAASDLESDITYALFTGAKRLDEEFTLSPPDPLFVMNTPPQDLQGLLLTPKQPHQQIKRVQIWLDKRHILHNLLLEDHFGVLTELRFQDVRLNALPANNAAQEQQLLDLDIPPGTEIIHQ